MKLNQENLKLVFGLKLKTFRHDKKLSLKEFSKLSGLSPSYINEIEKGKKFPKAEKIVQLAAALDIEYDELISSKLTKELNPVSQVLQSELLQKIPFDLFGFKSTDLIELMSNAPKKFSAFLSTLIEIARNYDLSQESFFLAALRSYQEIHNNYFPEIEEKVDSFRRQYSLNHVSNDTLISFLDDEYGLTVNFSRLSEQHELRTIRSVLVNQNTLLINERLTPDQKRFILAKEIGFRVLNLKKRSNTSSWSDDQSFDHILSNFQAGYFAGSFLLPKSELIHDMTHIFNSQKWDSEKLILIMQKYSVTPETFLTRLTQLIPQSFGLDQLFFLRYFHHLDTDKFEITKELHFSKLHSPHGVGLDEHYCRRWITISLLKEVHHAQKEDSETLKCGAQVSQFFDTNNQYLCISMARTLTLDEQTNSCLTIGFKLSEDLNETIKFVKDPNIVSKTVNETCERCGIMDCPERVAPPRIYERENKTTYQKKILKNLIAEFN